MAHWRTARVVVVWLRMRRLIDSVGLQSSIFAAVALVFSLISSAGIVLADHSWSKYHWDLSTAETLENQLKLGDNVSSMWDGSLSAASVDWNASVIKNAVVAGTSNANCDPTLERVEVCNGSYGEKGWRVYWDLVASRRLMRSVSGGIEMGRLPKRGSIGSCWPSLG